MQPANLAVLAKEHFRIHVFVGANQAKVKYDVVKAMHLLGVSAYWMKISGNGPNALGFHIAYYIGRLAQGDADAYFHTISKDTGFDSLIAHLKDRKIFASRSRDIADMSIVKIANSKTPAAKMDVVVTNFKQRGASKPRTLETPSGTINSLFQKALPEAGLGTLPEQMKRRGHIAASGTRVFHLLLARVSCRPC